MSATCPNNPPKRVDASAAWASGFTLLELIVVLVLVSVVTAMATPNLQRLYRAVARTTERNAILDRLANLGRRAMLERRTYLVVGTAASPDDEAAPSSGRVASFEHHEPYRMALPDGWAMHLPEPLLVRANGVCLGGEVALSYNGRPDVRLVLEPPYCRVDADA